jgi:cytochrome P450
MVLRTLLDVPASDAELLFGWVEVFYQALEAPPMSDEQLHETNSATRDAEQYFLALIRERRAALGDDFVSDLLRINAADDDPMTDGQLASNLYLMYFAGFDTQKLTFSSMVAALAAHPDAMRHLAEDPARLPSCMDEIYRYDPASQMLARTAGQDIELSGTTIRRGDTVIMSIGAAARDPELFDDPDTFDIHRGELPAVLRHLIFGAGRHHCLGAVQAQSNLPTMLRVLLERLGPMEVDWATAVRHPSLASRGYDVLPIVWDPART